ncbi:MAG: ankyrin repeat domain-containing protein [Proteobacteria bacterium]|nr:ankyrin repeat domain-containing protein [Pseudomonadota bacterium]
MSDDIVLRNLFVAIAGDDMASVRGLLHGAPGLARSALKDGATRAAATENFVTDIGHYVYAGDTALHVAAAAHRPEIALELIRLGADVAAGNRRGATPLHYAADGNPASARWDAAAQASTIVALIAAGADPNATDKGGVSPLHRAIRNRCAEAVAALVEGGADPSRANGSGSTPMALATQQTGRGGSGSPEAKAQQAEIIGLLERHGAA